MSDEEIISTDEDIVVEPTMDDTIRDTLAKIESRGTETEEIVEETDSRQRDDKGRFAKKEETESEVPVEVVQETIEAPLETFTVPPELQKLGLRKEEAEAVARDPVVMQAFMRRSEEMHKGLEQFKVKAQAHESMEQALAPFMPTIQQSGLPAHEAVKRIMAAEHGLRYGNEDSRAVAALNVLKSYNIDLNRLYSIASGQYQPQAQPQQPPQAQPDIHAIAQEAVQDAFLQQEINQFASSHEHFEELKPLIRSLLGEGTAANLEDAYQQALRAHPVHGPAWVTKQLSEAEEKRKQEAAAKAQAAKNAASVNITRRGSAPAAKPIGTMEDTIRETAEKLGIM